ncbi:hypothetical protein TSUD_220690 [Trifolium subterraneum]|uniref:RNase H type-1 domain-containing protein n=1 Tax=Trifolium subterraneum TaxID=3900 RepID=A0A2Z6N6G6_TRISU|nr:hypothetical protein TSUD_220690 [Trifolium subterraneum]
MSVYLVPDSTIKDIERLMNSFWWGGGNNNKGIRWLAQDRMTHTKAQGGMGFRDLHIFNLALIAKQGWHMMTKPHTLVAKLYRARWSIGNGASIKVMSEPWLRGQDSAWLPSPQSQGSVFFSVGSDVGTAITADNQCKSGYSRSPNNQVWNDVAEPGRSIGIKARHLWEEWLSVQQVQLDRRPHQQQQQVADWQKPTIGWYKCNVDAAFHRELNKTSSWWCLRDYMGRFVTAKTTWMEGNCSIMEGESAALLEAMKQMEQQGKSHVIF